MLPGDYAYEVLVSFNNKSHIFQEGRQLITKQTGLAGIAASEETAPSSRTRGPWTLTSRLMRAVGKCFITPYSLGKCTE